MGFMSACEQGRISAKSLVICDSQLRIRISPVQEGTKACVLHM